MTGRFFPVQSIALGPGNAFTNTYAALDYTGNGQYTLAGLLGAVVEDHGKVYRLVQHSEATVASAAGTPAYWLVRASNTVTSDESDGESGINGVAGGYLGVVTNQYYCWLQMGGLQSIVTDGNAVPGSACIGSTTDGVFDAMLVGAATWQGLPVGISNSTDSSTAGTMYWLLGSVL